jgi:hypothetical protein
METSIIARIPVDAPKKVNGACARNSDKITATRMLVCAEGLLGRCSFRSFPFQHVCIQSASCMDMASIGQAGIHIPSKSHFF